MTVEIDFNNEYRDLTDLNSDFYIPLINFVIQNENMECISVAVIWLTDAALAKLHTDYLNDPTETDVMTFDLGDDKIEAEIYISVDRAISQSKQFEIDLRTEIKRLLIHGLLHLAGFDDHTEMDIKEMRSRENYYLSKLS